METERIAALIWRFIGVFLALVSGVAFTLNLLSLLTLSAQMDGSILALLKMSPAIWMYFWGSLVFTFIGIGVIYASRKLGSILSRGL